MSKRPQPTAPTTATPTDTETTSAPTSAVAVIETPTDTPSAELLTPDEIRDGDDSAAIPMGETPTAPAGTTATPAPTATPTPDPVAVFAIAAKHATDNADSTTGTIAAGDLATVRLTFLGVAPKQRDAVRAGIQTELTNAMMGMSPTSATFARDMVRARALAEILSTITGLVGAKTDPITEASSVYTALLGALRIIIATLPTGTDVDAFRERCESNADTDYSDETIGALASWHNADAATRGDNPANAALQRAYRYAYGTTPRAATAGATGTPRAARTTTGDGTRRDVGAHIVSFVNTLGVGAFATFAAIHNHRSDEYGPNDAPTAGAIDARLRRHKTPIAGVSVEQRNSGTRTVWGVVRMAEFDADTYRAAPTATPTVVAPETPTPDSAS